MRRIAASRCTLEPMVAAHAPQMFEVLADPAIYEFENEPPASLEALRERYLRLERRGPADGSEQWLNWVVRLPNDELAGYVQATVLPSGESVVAYELNSAYWRQGVGSSAVRAMLGELDANYGVQLFVAVFKGRNFRSRALLRKLGFVAASAEQAARFADEADEEVAVRGTSELAFGEPSLPTLGRV